MGIKTKCMIIGKVFDGCLIHNLDLMDCFKLNLNELFKFLKLFIHGHFIKNWCNWDQDIIFSSFQWVNIKFFQVAYYFQH
jgi:hypothetical protein